MSPLYLGRRRRAEVGWELSKEDTGRDVVVFEVTGMTDGGEEVMVGEVFHVCGVDMRFELTATLIVLLPDTSPVRIDHSKRLTVILHHLGRR